MARGGTAYGAATQATGFESTAIGNNAVASAEQSTANGTLATAHWRRQAECYRPPAVTFPMPPVAVRQ
ncbi:hypothetical protein [Tsuneonella troitsensis]|uniref:hypothetical protein n=1 Tax=Tsuneonella troitsensis TaxID=292222 RepID=UPI00389A9606